MLRGSSVVDGILATKRSGKPLSLLFFFCLPKVAHSRFNNIDY